MQSYTKWGAQDLRALPRNRQGGRRLRDKHRSLRTTARNRRRVEARAGIIRQVPAYIRKDRGGAYASPTAKSPGHDAAFTFAGRESEA